MNSNANSEIKKLNMNLVKTESQLVKDINQINFTLKDVIDKNIDQDKVIHDILNKNTNDLIARITAVNTKADEFNASQTKNTDENKARIQKLNTDVNAEVSKLNDRIEQVSTNAQAMGKDLNSEIVNAESRIVQDLNQSNFNIKALVDKNAEQDKQTRVELDKLAKRAEEVFNHANVLNKECKNKMDQIDGRLNGIDKILKADI